MRGARNLQRNHVRPPREFLFSRRRGPSSWLRHVLHPLLHAVVPDNPQVRRCNVPVRCHERQLDLGPIAV